MILKITANIHRTSLNLAVLELSNDYQWFPVIYRRFITIEI